ncbi:hypothetical protein B0H17DRAFT_1134696 [Mycena rosella]|uniref:Uncharacterized protein n=1 Tax=Mycena rosella TaxID=1033263 RepID=A0AAD7DEU8_MYCRO|nr:hypothetical protein B0H17DRAFT_1134696 [Mycena rosella]
MAKLQVNIWHCNGGSMLPKVVITATSNLIFPDFLMSVGGVASGRIGGRLASTRYAPDGGVQDALPQRVMNAWAKRKGAGFPRRSCRLIPGASRCLHRRSIERALPGSYGKLPKLRLHPRRWVNYRETSQDLKWETAQDISGNLPKTAGDSASDRWLEDRRRSTEDLSGRLLKPQGAHSTQWETPHDPALEGGPQRRSGARGFSEATRKTSESWVSAECVELAGGNGGHAKSWGERRTSEPPVQNVKVRPNEIGQKPRHSLFGGPVSDRTLESIREVEIPAYQHIGGMT